MSMSEFYGASDEREAIATLHRAIELGVSFLDTADVYGQGHNEELIGKAIAGRRDEVVLTTKFGYDIDAARRFPVLDARTPLTPIASAWSAGHDAHPSSRAGM